MKIITTILLFLSLSQITFAEMIINFSEDEGFVEGQIASQIAPESIAWQESFPGQFVVEPSGEGILMVGGENARFREWAHATIGAEALGETLRFEVDFTFKRAVEKPTADTELGIFGIARDFVGKVPAGLYFQLVQNKWGNDRFTIKLSETIDRPSFVLSDGFTGSALGLSSGVPSTSDRLRMVMEAELGTDKDLKATLTLVNLTSGKTVAELSLGADSSAIPATENLIIMASTGRLSGVPGSRLMIDRFLIDGSAGSVLAANEAVREVTKTLSKDSSADLALSNTAVGMEPIRSIHLDKSGDTYTYLPEYCRIFRERILNHVDMQFPEKADSADLKIRFQIVPDIKYDGFIIEYTNDVLTVSATQEQGFLFALGKLLKTFRYGDTGLEPYVWTGEQEPYSPFRVIYFATHYNNWYQAAPVSDVVTYIEDLMLWGYNGIATWAQVKVLPSFDSPETEAVLRQNTRYQQVAERLGLINVACRIGNAAYRSQIKPEIANTPTDEPYPHGHVNHPIYLNPRKGNAMDILKEVFREHLEFYKESGVGIEYAVLWPYDDGGCYAPENHPWGANGFLFAAENQVETLHEVFPDAEVILGTWRFSNEEWDLWQEKWKGQDIEWAQYIFDDTSWPSSHLGSWDWIYKNDIPGGKPILSFAEITMHYGQPWGGMGMGYAPKKTKAYIAGLTNAGFSFRGGMPYSEGIHDDIDKALVADLYWNPDVSVSTSVAEYINFYFGTDAIAAVSAALSILPETYPRNEISGPDSTKIQDDYRHSIAAMELLEKAHPELANDWRWRLIFIRLNLDLLTIQGNLEWDAETSLDTFTDTYKPDRANQLIHELYDIYYLDPAAITPETLAIVVPGTPATNTPERKQFIEMMRKRYAEIHGKTDPVFIELEGGI